MPHLADTFNFPIRGPAMALALLSSSTSLVGSDSDSDDDVFYDAPSLSRRSSFTDAVAQPTSSETGDAGGARDRVEADSVALPRPTRVNVRMW